MSVKESIEKIEKQQKELLTQVVTSEHDLVLRQLAVNRLETVKLRVALSELTSLVAALLAENKEEDK